MRRRFSTARAGSAATTSASTGRDEVHPEGSYFSNGGSDGSAYREAAGADAFVAAEKARTKQAELAAVRNGIIPAAAGRRSRTRNAPRLQQRSMQYKDTSATTASLRTFRTYRPDPRFASATSAARPMSMRSSARICSTSPPHCLKQGQKGKSIYNKLVVISQVMKQHGKAKLLECRRLAELR